MNSNQQQQQQTQHPPLHKFQSHNFSSLQKSTDDSSLYRSHNPQIIQSHNLNAVQRSYQALSLSSMADSKFQGLEPKHSRNPSGQVSSQSAALNSNHLPYTYTKEQVGQNSKVKQGTNTITMQKVKSIVKDQTRERNCKTTSPKCQVAKLQQERDLAIEETRIKKVTKEGNTLQNGIQGNNGGTNNNNTKRQPFAELLIVLGLKYQDFVEQRRIQPQVVDSFPNLNEPEVAKEHSYVDNLIWICFPKGYSFQAYEKKNEGQICKPKIYHFIITNQDGKKKYITSLLFKVQFIDELFLSEKRGAFIVPKSLCLVSSQPSFTLQKQLLQLIFQKVILRNNGASIQAYSQHPSNYISYLNELKHQSIKRNPEDHLQHKIEFYITIFFKHFYHSEDIENDIEVDEIHEKSTPHTSTNKGKGGGTRLVHESLFRYRCTKNYGFALENYSFELLKCLKPERILQLITALLLERKIILIKEKFGDIALIMESLVSLMSPLKWNFVFITYLTPKLLDCLEAPFPYIIGVSKKIWEEHCMMRELPTDIIIYDLDNAEMLNQMKEELPPLPEPQSSILAKTLKELLYMKESFISLIQQNAPKHINKEKIDEFYWGYAQLRIKQGFFNFFLLTINNYIGYFKSMDEEGDLSPNKKDKKFYDKLTSQDVFDFEGYLSQFSPQNRILMDKLVNTQSFNNFIEDTYQNTNQKSEIGFFKTNMEVIINHSFKKLKKEQNKIIDQTFYNLQNPVKFNIRYMFKQFKNQLMKKHEDRLRQIYEEDLTNTDDVLLNLSGPDLLEKLLLEEIEGNQTKQLSLINSLNHGLIVDMPGIEYEQISTYKQLKSQKSEQSLERKASIAIQAFELAQNQTFQEQNNNNNGKSNKEMSESEAKSRNYVKQSRSGGSGIMYNNFLSMADNTKDKNQIKIYRKDMGVLSGLQHMTQEIKEDQELQEQDDDKAGLKIFKGRVHSENSFAKNMKSIALNKTMIVSNNSEIQRAATTTKNLQGSKSKTSRLDNVSIAVIINNIIYNQYLQQKKLSKKIYPIQEVNKVGSQSPRILVHQKSKFNDTMNLSNNSLSVDLSINGGIQQQQQQFLKEALDKKINHHRTKHGLQLKSEDPHKQQSQISQNQLILISSQSPKEQLQKEDFPLSGKSTTNWKHIPKMNIDLMNPIQKKISRNEERKIAKVKGFYDLKQHNSFYSFCSPQEEELNKIAKMQKFGEKMKKENSSNIINGNNGNSAILNFHSNFIQQKPHISQSPTITNTDFSNSKKSNQQLIEEDIIPSDSLSPYVQVTKPATRMGGGGTINQSPVQIDKSKQRTLEPGQSPPHQILEEIMQRNKSNLYFNPQLHDFKKNLMRSQQFDMMTQSYDQTQFGLIKEEEMNIKLNKQISQPSQQIQIGEKSNKLKQAESPSVSMSQQNLSLKTFANQSKDSKNNSQLDKNKRFQASMIVSHKSPNNQKLTNSTSKVQGFQNSKFGQLQTFDAAKRNELQIQKPNNPGAIQRKKSQPMLGMEKGQNSKSTNSHQQKGTTVKVGNSLSNSKQYQQQQKGQQYFKQRPKQQNTEQNQKQASVQIDLERKKKLSSQGSREIDLAHQQSLRISPIPNLTQTLDQQYKNQYISSNDHIKEQMQMTYTQQPQLQISSGVVERESDKFFQMKPKGGSESTQVIEVEIFGRAKISQDPMILSTKNIRQQANPMSAKNSIGSSSHRSSVIQNNRQRSSDVKYFCNNARGSEKILCGIEEFKKEEQGFDQAYNNHYSGRQSDVLSQNEASNNVSISIQKSSPRFLGKSKQGNRPPMGKQNFMMIGNNNNNNSSSIMNSADITQIQNLINGLKSSSNVNNNGNNGSLKEQIGNIGNGQKQSNRSSNAKGYGKGEKNLQNRANSQEFSMIDQQSNQKQLKSIKHKQAKSPQPSSQMVSTNKYMKTLHTQDYYINDSEIKMVNGNYNSLIKQTILNQQQQDFQQKQQLNQHQHKNSSNSNNNNKNKRMQKHQSIANIGRDNRVYQSNQELCRSTKNLFDSKGKLHLLNDLDYVNDSLGKLEDVRIKARKSGLNILEESLIQRKTASLNSFQKQQSPSNDLKQKHQLFSYAINRQSNIEQNNRQKISLQGGEGKDKRQSSSPKIIQYQDELEQRGAKRKEEMERSSDIVKTIKQIMDLQPNKKEHQGKQIIKSRQYLKNKYNIDQSSQQKYSETLQQPLIELKHQHNEQNIIDVVSTGMKHKHGNSEASLNNSKMTKIIGIDSEKSENNSNHSSLNANSRSCNNNSEKQQAILNKKKRTFRHGLTTCFVFPAKESKEYIRRDLNQDVFCKINSHLGDIDNDPHTPRSIGSPKNNDKSHRRLQRKLKMQQTSQINKQYQQQQFESNNNKFEENLNETPSRHSSSIDGRLLLNFPQSEMIPPQLQQRKNTADFHLLQESTRSKFAEPKVITLDMCKPARKVENGVTYEILFEDADLRDTDDKFTSRDVNFNRLKGYNHIL